MAMDFAEDDRRKEDEDVAWIDVNHFNRVLRLEETFQTDLQNAKDGTLENVEDGEE